MLNNLSTLVRPRPAQQADWAAIMDALSVIVVGDMNAHSRIWNGRAAYQLNDTFWEDLIETHGLTIHNSEEATRSGANAEYHSIIDLTLTKGNADLRWSITSDDQSRSRNPSLGGCRERSGGTCKVTTGRDLRKAQA